MGRGQGMSAEETAAARDAEIQARLVASERRMRHLLARGQQGVAGQSGQNTQTSRAARDTPDREANAAGQSADPRFPRLDPRGRLAGGGKADPHQTVRPWRPRVPTATSAAGAAATERSARSGRKERGRPPDGRRAGAATDEARLVGHVTKVVPVADHPGRWTIWIDGLRWGRVSDDLVQRLGLLAEPQLAAEALDTVAQQCVETLLRDRALGSLSRSDQARSRLEQKLRRPLPPGLGGGRVSESDQREIIATVLAWVEAKGWLDETRQATDRTDAWRRQGLPARAIARRLRARGLSSDAVQAASRAMREREEEAPEEHEAAHEAVKGTAWALVVRRTRQLRTKSPREAEQMIRRWLAGRGYDGDLVREIVAQWRAQERDAADAGADADSSSGAADDEGDTTA